MAQKARVSAISEQLHALGVDDKSIQAILRHSNIATTQGIYNKGVNESQVSAMDRLAKKSEYATTTKGPVN
jgi:site-specific recombinase XerD